MNMLGANMFGNAPQPYNMQSPVLLAQPVFARLLVIFFSGLLFVAIIFSIFTQYSQHETVQGEITAANGFSVVGAEQAGIISELFVKPGQRVTEGQPLALLNIPAIVAKNGDTVALSIERISASLANIDMQINEYDRAISDARRQITEIEASSNSSLQSARARKTLTGRRQDLANERLKGYETLAQKGFVTNMAVDQARTASLELQQETAETDLTIDEISRGRIDRIATIETRINELRQATLAMQTQRLQVENEIHERQVLQSIKIVAPTSGVLTALSIKTGQRVEVGQHILAIGQPSSKLTAILEVPSKSIGLIEPGQRVVLKYDAFPYQSFGVRYGKVIRVENASLQSRDAAAETEAAGLDRRFIVEVEPDDKAIVAYGRARSLKVGMTLTADIEYERRSLMEWFLAPLLSLDGRLS